MDATTWPGRRPRAFGEQSFDFCRRVLVGALERAVALDGALHMLGHGGSLHHGVAGRVPHAHPRLGLPQLGSELLVERGRLAGHDGGDQHDRRCRYRDQRGDEHSLAGALAQLAPRKAQCGAAASEGAEKRAHSVPPASRDSG